MRRQRNLLLGVIGLLVWLVEGCTTTATLPVFPNQPPSIWDWAEIESILIEGLAQLPAHATPQAMEELPIGPMDPSNLYLPQLTALS